MDRPFAGEHASRDPAPIQKDRRKYRISLFVAIVAMITYLGTILTGNQTPLSESTTAHTIFLIAMIGFNVSLVSLYFDRARNPSIKVSDHLVFLCGGMFVAIIGNVITSIVCLLANPHYVNVVLVLVSLGNVYIGYSERYGIMPFVLDEQVIKKP